jgi:histone acetyltransferase 1
MADAAAAKRRRLEALMGGGPGGADGFGDRAGPSSSNAGAPSEAAAPPAGAVFEAQANEALSFRLVRTPEELDTAPTFHPEFTHQVFREDETIFGYRDLKARARRSGEQACFTTPR